LTFAAQESIKMDDEIVLRTNITHRIRERVDPIGNFLAEVFHFLGLFAIGGATVWAAIKAFLSMSEKGHASIGRDDFLLRPPPRRRWRRGHC